MFFSHLPMQRMLAAALSLLLGAALFTGCTAGDDDTPVMDPNNPNLIAGEEKILTDPFIYSQHDLSEYVTLGNYRGINATRASSVLTDAEFEQQIQVMLEYYAEPTKITDRAAAAGDTCNFDFAGYIDGEQFDGGTAAGASITLTGNGGFIEGFVPAMIGKTPGESFDVDTTFPDDYREESLRGKKAVFKCTLNYIEGEPIVPVLDDKFAQDIAGMNTAEELRADLRGKLELDKAAQVADQLYNDIWMQVVANATVHKYPEEKVTFVYQQFVLQYTSYAAMSYSATYEEYIAMMGISDEDVRAMAREQVKDDLVFYALTKAENIAVDDAEYEANLAEFSASMNMDPETLLEQYGKESIRDGMLWNKTQDLLLSWANVTDAK